jgi:hypothetical protein
MVETKPGWTPPVMPPHKSSASIKAAPHGALYIASGERITRHIHAIHEHKRTDIILMRRDVLTIPQKVFGKKYSAVILDPGLIPTAAEQKVLAALQARAVP